MQAGLPRSESGEVVRLGSNEARKADVRLQLPRTDLRQLVAEAFARLSSASTAATRHPEPASGEDIPPLVSHVIDRLPTNWPRSREVIVPGITDAR
jgi:hypothetical protein